MAQFSVTMLGTHALAEGLKERASLDLVKMVVKYNGAELMRRMVREASFKGHVNSRGQFVNPTGATKRSITIRFEDNGFTVKVFPQTHYSPYLEYGTRFMTAQPFVRPAHQAIYPQFMRDIKKLMK